MEYSVLVWLHCVGVPSHSRTPAG